MWESFERPVLVVTGDPWQTSTKGAILKEGNEALNARLFIWCQDMINGQRTACESHYTRGGVSWNHWTGIAIVLRPEVR